MLWSLDVTSGPFNWVLGSRPEMEPDLCIEIFLEVMWKVNLGVENRVAARETREEGEREIKEGERLCNDFNSMYLRKFSIQNQ